MSTNALIDLAASTLHALQSSKYLHYSIYYTTMALLDLEFRFLKSDIAPSAHSLISSCSQLHLIYALFLDPVLGF